jgi:hypothetical protein
MPFAGYKDFAECVRKNADKKDPKAYCGTIQAATEGVMTKKQSSTPTLEEFRATEIIDFDGGFISAQEGEDGRLTAKIRIIKAGLSKNNRNYRPSALKRAAQEGIFDGVRMFVDHAQKGKTSLSRSFMDMVSAIESTEYDEPNQALNGNVEFFDEDFYKRVKRAQAFAGISIDSLLRGTRTPQPGGRALEDVHAFTHPRSVDWVVYPAAGGQLLATESEEEGESVGDIDWAAIEAEAGTLTAEDIQKNSPTLWKLFHPEGTANKLPVHGNAPESTAAEYVAKEEVDALVDARFEAYRKEQKRIEDLKESAAEQVRAAFATSGLPPVVRARVMHGFEGITEFKQEEVQKAIDDAKEELKAVGVGPHISGMGPGGTPVNDGEIKTFSVKESVEAQFGKKPVAASGDASKEGK